MNLGQKVNDLLTALGGPKKVFEENRSEFENLGLNFESFRQRIHRFKDKEDHKLTDDMIFLNILLKSLKLTFEEFMSGEKNVVTHNEDRTDERGTITQDKLLQMIHQNVGYIRLKLEKNEKKRIPNDEKLFMILRLMNELSSITTKSSSKSTSTFSPLLSNKKTNFQNAFLLKEIYLPYLYTDDVVNELSFRLLTVDSHKDATTGEVPLLLGYVILHNVTKLVNAYKTKIIVEGENFNELVATTKNYIKKVIQAISENELNWKNILIQDNSSKILLDISEIMIETLELKSQPVFDRNKFIQDMIVKKHASVKLNSNYSEWTINLGSHVNEIYILNNELIKLRSFIIEGVK